MHFIELSHVIEHQMITYKGLPGPVISEFLSREASRVHYSEGTEFSIGKIEMVSNTGTYIDSPFHRYPDGQDLSQITIKSLAHLPGILISIPHDLKAIDATAFNEKNLEGKAVLIHTGWSRYWRTDHYCSGLHAYLTRGAAEYCVQNRAVLVGIDSYNIDDTNDRERPVHSILLRASIPVIEHLCNIKELPETGFTFYAIPPMIKGLGSFPVRAFAIVE